MHLELLKTILVYLGSKKSWVEVFNQVTSSSMADLSTVCDKDGNHLLHLAAFQGDLNAVETLIECHVDVNILNGFEKRRFTLQLQQE